MSFHKFRALPESVYRVVDDLPESVCQLRPYRATTDDTFSVCAYEGFQQCTIRCLVGGWASSETVMSCNRWAIALLVYVNCPPEHFNQRSGAAWLLGTLAATPASDSLRAFLLLFLIGGRPFWEHPVQLSGELYWVCLCLLIKIQHKPTQWEQTTAAARHSLKAECANQADCLWCLIQLRPA